MNSLLVTPTSEADLQLLTALFKKMKIKAQVLPDDSSARASKLGITPSAERLQAFVPQNRGEELMLEAVLEMKEVIDGRKKAMTMEEFWKAMDEE